MRGCRGWVAGFDLLVDKAVDMLPMSHCGSVEIWASRDLDSCLCSCKLVSCARVSFLLVLLNQLLGSCDFVARFLDDDLDGDDTGTDSTNESNRFGPIGTPLALTALRATRAPRAARAPRARGLADGSRLARAVPCCSFRLPFEPAVGTGCQASLREALALPLSNSPCSHMLCMRSRACSMVSGTAQLSV